MGKPSKGGSIDTTTISGNKRDNTLTGTDASEILDGKDGNDILIGGGGDDTILGGNGTDTVVFAGARDSYVISLLEGGSIQVVGAEGTAIVFDVEVFEFSDMTQSADEVLIPRLANLSAGVLTLDDTQLSPGETATLTFDVASNGVIDAGGSTAELVFAASPDESAILGSLGSVDLSSLATGESDTLSLTVDPGTLDPGSYWVAVRVDAGDAISESDESDNLTEWVEITVEAPVADLRLNAAALGENTDLDLTNGGQIEISYEIEDASNIDVSYFSVVTYLSSDATVSADDLRIAGATGGTYPGLTTSFTTSHYFQEDFTPGDYYLISVVEWGDGSTDATPEDNVIVQTATFTPPPAPTVDVAITDVTIDPGSDLDLGPDGAYSESDGAHLTFGIDLANLGSGYASGLSLVAYLSEDGTLSTDDVAIWSGSTSLAAGDSNTISASADLDMSFYAGDYQIIFVATAPEDIDASNDVAATGVSLIGGVDADAGTEGDDLWVSSAGSDVVSLLGGDDIAIAGAGCDQVDGGAGVDTIDFSDSLSGMELYVDEGTTGPLLVSRLMGNTTEASTWTGFEALVLTDFDDQVILAGSEVTDVALGAGDDEAIGSLGDDHIDGGAGNDFLSGFFGNDILVTGDGFDFVAVQRDTSTGVVIGFGNDTVEDFDVLQDIIGITVGSGESYDPFADLIQTADGALLTYADDSSLLLLGVDVSELTAQNFVVSEPEVIAY